MNGIITITCADGASLTGALPLRAVPGIVSIGGAWVAGARIDADAFAATFGDFLACHADIDWITHVVEYAINEGPAYYERTRNIGSGFYPDDGSDADPLFVSWHIPGGSAFLDECDREAEAINREFPESYATALPPIPADWRADHWGNDACPSWIAYQSGDSVDDALTVKVYVDHADPDKRESPYYPRFSVTTDRDDGHNPDAEYVGDDWSAVLAVVARIAAR
jgi:hypothetical protein